MNKWQSMMIKINEVINERINVWDVSKNPLADSQWYKKNERINDNHQCMRWKVPFESKG